MKIKKITAIALAPLLLILTACSGSSVKVNNLNADAFASDIKNLGVVILEIGRAHV